MKRFPWPHIAAARAIKDGSGLLGAQLLGLARSLAALAPAEARLSHFAGAATSIVWQKRLGEASALELPGTIAILVSPSGHPEGAAPYVICVHSTLVSRLASAALALPTALLPRTLELPTPPVCGAAAALVADMLRHAAGAAVRVHDAMPGAHVRARFGMPKAGDVESSFVATTLSIVVGAEVFECLVLVPRSALALAAHHAYLGLTAPELSLRVPIVAATLWLAREELANLSAGDVVQCTLPIELRNQQRATLEGDVWLCPPSAEDGFRVRMHGTTATLVSALREALLWDAAPPRSQASTPEGDPSMSDEHTPPPEPTTADAPEVAALANAQQPRIQSWLQRASVVVRVEVGAVEMLAAEWTALREGDVVSLNIGPEAGVTLRAGGRAMARGELVVVDGAVGVRITERIE